MEKQFSVSHLKICVRGGGDLASGIAWRLHRCGFQVLITEIEEPLAVRRTVSFCEAVYDGTASVEGVEAELIKGVKEIPAAWARGHIPILVDPVCEVRSEFGLDVLVDAILAKRNLGTSLKDAPLVIGVGPGFTAGMDAHLVVETNRGHYLGRLLNRGSAQENTGIPGPVQGVTTDRVLRASADGIWECSSGIGRMVKAGDTVGTIAGKPMQALISGVLRGLIRPGIKVKNGLKIGDIDPRGIREYCFTISEKALAIAGGVLEGILSFHKGGVT